MFIWFNYCNIRDTEEVKEEWKKQRIKKKIIEFNRDLYEKRYYSLDSFMNVMKRDAAWVFIINICDWIIPFCFILPFICLRNENEEQDVG